MKSKDERKSPSSFVREAGTIHVIIMYKGQESAHGLAYAAVGILLYDNAVGRVAGPASVRSEAPHDGP